MSATSKPELTVFGYVKRFCGNYGTIPSDVISIIVLYYYFCFKFYTKNMENI